MKCPTCNIMLVSADRDGIEIDFCPSCWGIWLDKGELNQIVARSVSSSGRQTAGAATHLPLDSQAALVPSSVSA